MQYTLDEQQCQNLEVSTRREWVLPNGIGGYAMGTVSGINARRYHGHLVAAITPPTGRMMLLAAIEATVQGVGNPVGISANQYPGAIFPEGYHYLRSFSVGKSALWKFKVSGMSVEKELIVHQGANAVTVIYRNTGPSAISIILRPLVEHRDHHGNFQEHSGYPSSLDFPKDETVVTDQGVSLHLSHPGAERTPVQGWYYRFEHAREAERGLAPRDDLFCPCELKYDLAAGGEICLVASIEPGTAPVDLETEVDADSSLTAMLRDAAETFFVSTPERSSIIAGYPWFTDWGRDTMISIPGLCLHTGRIKLARQILTDYAKQIYQGLIPNRFVEKGETPDYNTVDATLWFAHATYKTLEAEYDEAFAGFMSEKLYEIFQWHMKGTLFGIKVDPSDGLLTQGEPGVQLTWMDAKVGDWVVTPRHGKPVEINGLWINLLRSAASIGRRAGVAASRIKEYEDAADLAQSCFEEKFWHEGRGHYLDTVDPADATLRPNQLIPMALPFVELDRGHAARALGVVSRELLTPVGIRTLGPEEPGYRGQYKGAMNELDAAYHQGTAWPWLMGPYATALRRYGGDRRAPKRALKAAKTMLSEYGIGGLAEVYDGSSPQSPGGCPWQAWSVAEMLRAWIEDAGGD